MDVARLPRGVIPPKSFDCRAKSKPQADKLTGRPSNSLAGCCQRGVSRRFFNGPYLTCLTHS